MKKCTKCKIIKDYKEFRTRKGSKDGLQSNCKECEKEQRKAHYLKNKEKECPYCGIDIKDYLYNN